MKAIIKFHDPHESDRVIIRIKTLIVTDHHVNLEYWYGMGRRLVRTSFQLALVKRVYAAADAEEC